MRLGILICALITMSCNKDLPDRQELMDQFYQEQVDDFLENRKRDCMRSAERAAQIKVDSLIDNWINASLFDTLNFPSKPTKPSTPEHIIDKVSRF